MARGTGAGLHDGVRDFLRSPTVPSTIFQADQDEFVRDQSPFAAVERFPSVVSHNGPIMHGPSIEAIASRVAELAGHSRAKTGS
jgi:hypothetical protein